MHLSHKPTASSSSSSLPSPSSFISGVNHVNGDGNDYNFIGNKGQSFTQRRLTRQRKLRHLSDHDLGWYMRVTSTSLPASPESTRRSSSPASSDHWSYSAVPQPLPLPEFSLTRRPESTVSHSHSGQAQLRSPPQEHPGAALGRKNGDHVSTKSKSSGNYKYSHDLTVDEAKYNLGVKIPAASISSNDLSSPVAPRKFSRGDVFPSYVAKNSANSLNNNSKGFSQDVTVDEAKYNLRVKIPAASISSNELSSPVAPRKFSRGDVFPSYVAKNSANSLNNNSKGFSQDVDIEAINYNSRRHSSVRSAPTSVFSSPTASPRRSSNVEFFPLSCGVCCEFQNNHAGCSSKKESPVKTQRSAGHSPLHSPTGHGYYLNPKSQEGVAIHQHHKLVNMEWPENNSHVAAQCAHPLPLPPRAISPVQSSIQPQSAVVHHTLENPFVSSMKGQWQKGKLIGRGTFGSVYMATNLETGASCAMKEVDLIPDDPKSAECIKQLEQEIKVLRQLDHPNIVRYYGSQIVDDHFYIYLEYVYPGSINKFIRDHCGAITESVVRNFTRHIVSGLAYLHSTKTIHRDIKGANLLVDASGTVKLADFGMAKHLTGLSYDLSLKGSPYWMAPEVMKAAIKKDADPNLALAVDIWSLGCTIIEMLTGKPPWSEFEGPQAMFKVLHRSPPIPETLSSDGKDFLQQCFQRDPADRPPAEKLLEHRFVQNSHDQNVLVHPQTYSRLNLSDKSHSPRDCAKQGTDSMPVSQGTRIMTRNVQCCRSSLSSIYHQT
ncbi:mitogen-activated protein kinase kinase kinase YODA-like [Quillaja saponaria]|uniref:mitogen-activated protein kinase kinase kinase n=1 Tax=Quillaja saponaria TaxID=32244 RepID=A0AAD7LHN1_QUISA|nr:mitogen-activated protein kinase kinase kinase YODA-like [Quillaja saponaria]